MMLMTKKFRYFPSIEVAKGVTATDVAHHIEEGGEICTTSSNRPFCEMNGIFAGTECAAHEMFIETERIVYPMFLRQVNEGCLRMVENEFCEGEEVHFFYYTPTTADIVMQGALECNASCIRALKDLVEDCEWRERRNDR